MVFQHFNLVSRSPVITNVLAGRLGYVNPAMSLLNRFPESDTQAALKQLERVGIANQAYKRADELSGGQQQRVGIARAMIQDPDMVLADEPVASLDPVSSEEIMTLLREICDRDGITVVVNLHQVELARRFADRIIGMSSGKIVFDDSPQQMTQSALRTIYQREGIKDDHSLDMALAYA